MAQRIISNTFTLTAYLGSKTYVNTLVVDQGKLHQFYDKDDGGKCSPDWETTTSEQPKFHLECRSTDGTLQNTEVSTTKLYYNESLITFSNNVSSGTFAGMFKYADIPATDKTPAYRQYTIVKNIATAGNMDNDTIRVEAQIKTEGNNLETVSTPITTIHVIPAASGGSAYFMEIEAPAILAGSTKTNIKAHVYKSDGAGEITSGVKWAWKRLDGETYSPVGSSQTLEVQASTVNGFEHFICEATIGSIKVVGACSVFDYNDGIFIAYEMTGVGNPTNMKSGEIAKITASVVDKEGNTKDDYSGNLTFTLIDKARDTKVVKTANSIEIKGTDVLKTYGGSVTGYITLEG